MEGELVCHRIVGRIVLTQDANIASLTSFGLGIAKASTNDGPVIGGQLDPLVGNELGTKDWLWTGTVTLPANAFNNAVHGDRPFDIRVKRRLESNERIVVVVTNPAGQVAIHVDIDVRILIVIRI